MRFYEGLRRNKNAIKVKKKLYTSNKIRKISSNFVRIKIESNVRKHLIKKITRRLCINNIDIWLLKSKKYRIQLKKKKSVYKMSSQTATRSKIKINHPLWGSPFSAHYYFNRIDGLLWNVRALNVYKKCILTCARCAISVGTKTLV